MEKFKIVGISSPQQNGSGTNLPSLIDLQDQQKKAARAEYAGERAVILFGLYRKGEANDPDTYVAGITAVLAEYDEEIMRRVTDPREGIARASKWLPSIAELTEECEKIKRTVASEMYMRSQGFSWDGRKWIKP